jgi:septal ring factor EnvC (AmiA/AmiB activator)
MHLLVLLATLKFTTIIPIISALFSGGLLGTLLKWRPERDTIVASATKQAIEVFESSIKQLKEDLKAAQDEAAKLTEELSKARQEVSEMMAERSRMNEELAYLRRRVDELERKLEGHP